MNLNGSTSMAYSNIQGLPGAFSDNGNFDDNPQFCNPAVGNFELAESSSSHFLVQESSFVGGWGGSTANPTGKLKPLPKEGRFF